MNNNNIIIRACPVCGSKPSIDTSIRKEGNYDPYVNVVIACSNVDCGYIKPSRSAFGNVEHAIDEWNKEVHRFEQIRVGSQLRGRAEGEK